MALVKCEECKGSLSTKAPTCPHCGCPNKDFKGEKSAVTHQTTVRVCNDCGRSFSSKGDRCPRCGCYNEPLSKIKRIQTNVDAGNFCSDCNRQIPVQSSKCPYCGGTREPSVNDKVNVEEPESMDDQGASEAMKATGGCALGCLLTVVFFVICALTLGGDESRKDKNHTKIKLKPHAHLTQEDYLEQVRRELKSLSKFSVRTHTKSKDSIMTCLLLFGSWTLIVEEAAGYRIESKEHLDLVSKMKKEVRRVQRLAFPKLRDAYGPLVRKDLWEDDMSAKTFGARFTVIEFVGRAFAANRNIKKWNQRVRETLRMLRFKQVRYKWIKSATEYTYFTLDAKPDDALIIWKGGTSYREVD